jgi:hypothetical protein
VEKTSDGVLQGTFSTNVMIPYHQPETCMEPDVVHVLLLLSIGFLQVVMELLEYVLN